MTTPTPAQSAATPPETPTAQPLYANHYKCPDCAHEWTDVWSAMSDDACPHCGLTNVSPTRSDDIGHSATSTLRPYDRKQLHRLARLYDFRALLFALASEAHDDGATRLGLDLKNLAVEWVQNGLGVTAEIDYMPAPEPRTADGIPVALFLAESRALSDGAKEIVDAIREESPRGAEMIKRLGGRLELLLDAMNAPYPLTITDSPVRE